LINKKINFLVVFCIGFLLSGCLERTVEIKSSPQGALAIVNGQEIGRTPCKFYFDHFGTYDVVLKHPETETLITTGEAVEPIWELPGIDLVTELVPFKLKTEITWNYQLNKKSIPQQILIKRALEMRKKTDGSNK
tara:strand:+ start:190 stop:594 length:405 start_codon:yes stop_codon:yes gene_type:complete